jgi:hypothetical protein
LSEDVSISKFFDDAMRAQLEKEENVDVAEVQLSPVEERDTTQ